MLSVIRYGGMAELVERRPRELLFQGGILLASCMFRIAFVVVPLLQAHHLHSIKCVYEETEA